jgi:predicted transposase YdaD
MCKAIQEMREDARLEGRNEGLIEGRNEGLIEGRNEGRSEGARDANIKTAKKVIALGKLSFDEISAIYNLTPEEVQKLAEEI